MKKIFFLFFILVCFSFIYSSKVDNTITKEDIKYINKFLIDGNIDKYNNINQLNAELQINVIEKVQDIVLKTSPNLKSLPLCTLREPKQIYYSKNSSCSERSRVIEKILRYIGFKTRHITLYKSTGLSFEFLALLRPNQPSHAVVEVYTKYGWIVVGSNYRWIARNNKKYLSISEINAVNDLNKPINWKVSPQENILDKQFIYIYGLYSRHGKFYPPYNFIPDINYSDFMYNFID